MVDVEIKRELRVSCEKVKAIREQAFLLCMGKEVKIVSNFNGQSYGHSRPSLKGKIFKIRAVLIDGSGCQVWDGDFNHCYVPINQVEFI